MKKTYSIIKDLNKLKEFVNYLPVPNDEERYQVQLISRNKYLQEDKKNSQSHIIQSFYDLKKIDIIPVIERMEVPLGSYKIKGIPIQEESLCVYMCYNPYNRVKAHTKMLASLASMNCNKELNTSTNKIVSSSIAKAIERKLIMSIDVDDSYKEDMYGQLIDEIIHYSSYRILNTKGGFHILVDLTSYYLTKDWLKKLKEKIVCDVCGVSTLNPVPGCIQGDYVPYFE